jgi:hypothetical protein
MNMQNGVEDGKRSQIESNKQGVKARDEKRSQRKAFNI